MIAASISKNIPHHRSNRQMTTALPFAPGRRIGVAAIVLAGGLLMGLAGCAQRVSPYEVTGALPDDYRTNHPITIEEQVETLDVPVSVDTQRLTPEVRSNIAFFAQRFIDSGTAIIAVVAPSGSPNQVAAASAAVEVEDVLRHSGINPRAIDYRVYRAGAGEKIAPVRVAFNHIAAHTAPCGPWTDQTASNADNRNYGGFGCATQQNLAAMVDNPLDLLYPRGLTPADATRRAAVLEKYRQGQNFTSDHSGETGGTIAQGVGN
jgi:pilus assembly protein CpaD